MAERIYDGNFSEPEASGGPSFSAPLPGVNVDYVLSQYWVQRETDYTSLPLNTPHPDYPEYLLVEEGPHEDMGGGIMRWLRTYAKTPTSYSEPGGNIAYQFIGYQGPTVIESGQPTPTGRLPFTAVVPLQISYDFYAVGIDVATVDDIPIIDETIYYVGSEDVRVKYVADASIVQFDTTPSRTQYEALVAADDYNIVVEPSIVRRWMGSIFIRETRRIKAR